jgi:DNA-binding GntR family transcriptional regulator
VQRTGAVLQDEPLVSPVTWERIYADVESELAARISFGSWRVNEAELARHHRVSRTVTRDVVGRLQQKGVLRKDARSRWYVPALTPDYIGELYEMRSLLEPVALAKAVPCVPDGFIAGMRENLEAALADPQAMKDGAFDRLETEMHETLLGFCGNQTLMLAIELPQSLLIAHRFLYKWTPRLFDPEPFLHEHLAIVRNLEKGRIGKAAELLREHLLVSRERATERIRSLEGKFSPDNLPYLTLMSPN